MDIMNTSPYDWGFFAKGNANLLFQYLGLDPALKPKLLRLRLKKDQQTYLLTRDVKHFMDAILEEKFTEESIESKLVALPPLFLQNLDDKENELMLTETHGLLLVNILYGYDHHYRFSKHCTLHIKKTPTAVQSIIFELKPKWLYDNQKNYCRTCLLLQMKGEERHFCPLDLLYPHAVPKGVSDMLSKCPKTIESLLLQSNFPVADILVKYFQSPFSILLRLKHEQDKLDDGTNISEITSESQVLDNLTLRMTLRDVGVFLVITPSEENSDTRLKKIDVDGYGCFGVGAYIYDLDPKSKSRHRHWASTEQKLNLIYHSTNSGWRYCVKASK